MMDAYNSFLEANIGNRDNFFVWIAARYSNINRRRKNTGPHNDYKMYIYRRVLVGVLRSGP